MNALARLPSTPEPMHHWQGFGGVTLAGDAWGDPNGPLVILLHGGGQTRHAWKGAGQTMGSAGYYAVAFDARGHGDSDWAPDGNYGQDTMVEDLRLLVAELGKRPVLVGASMGGGTSLVAVGEEHVDATALVLVDIAPRIDPTGAGRIQAFMSANPDGFGSLEEVADAIAGYQPQRTRPRNLEGLGKNVRVGDDGRYHWHWDPQAMGRRDVDFNQRQDRLEACARHLTLPTLLVRGGLSDILTEEGAKEFLDLCPQAEYVNVEGAAHMVAGDRNDIFSGAVIDFLSRTVPVDGAPVHAPHPLAPRHLGPPGDLTDVP
jgi:non-heme chloroperoxidase